MPRNERYQRREGAHPFKSETTPDKHSELIDLLTQQVESVHDSASFQRYLAIQARFHKYSFGNVMLIAAQRPEAERVAGYKRWQELGRQVKKGERAIKIIVPYIGKDRETEERKVTGFGVGNVFDVSQTEGDPLPEHNVPVLEGDNGGYLYTGLADVAREEGVVVEKRERFNPLSAMGSYHPDSKLILLRSGVGQLQQTKTLAHELGHHFTGMHETYGELRAEHETVAESVAFVVCTRFGLDTADRSVPYIAGWSENKDRFRSVLGTIQGVSAQLITRLEGKLAAADEPLEPAEPDPLGQALFPQMSPYRYHP